MYILDRGPFTLDGECDLLREHDIDVIVAKNSGGAATYAKIEAARLLGIEVMMVARAPASIVKAVDTVEAALAAIDHLFPRHETRRIDEVQSAWPRDDACLGRADDDAGRHIGNRRICLRQLLDGDTFVRPPGRPPENNRCCCRQMVTQQLEGFAELPGPRPADRIIKRDDKTRLCRQYKTVFYYIPRL